MFHTRTAPKLTAVFLTAWSPGSFAAKLVAPTRNEGFGQVFTVSNRADCLQLLRRFGINTPDDFGIQQDTAAEAFDGGGGGGDTEADAEGASSATSKHFCDQYDTASASIDDAATPIGVQLSAVAFATSEAASKLRQRRRRRAELPLDDERARANLEAQADEAEALLVIFGEQFTYSKVDGTCMVQLTVNVDDPSGPQDITVKIKFGEGYPTLAPPLADFNNATGIAPHLLKYARDQLDVMHAEADGEIYLFQYFEWLRWDWLSAGTRGV